MKLPGPTRVICFCSVESYSLSHLLRLPVKLLKIDQMFVREMLNGPDNLAILGSLIRLGTPCRCQIIAEGVETEEQITKLLQLGCDLAQGYGIAHPMPASDLPVWVAGAGSRIRPSR